MSFSKLPQLMGDESAQKGGQRSVTLLSFHVRDTEDLTGSGERGHRIFGAGLTNPWKQLGFLHLLS
jgi:hypothetical protein